MYDNDLKQFYVTLFSNASQSLYPNYTIGAFTVELSRPIKLGPNDKWEVGLCIISYLPNRVGTLQSVSIVGETTVLVYTDLISPQYVRKKLVRCLRTFIYPTLRGEHIYNIYYLPVEKQTVKNRRIEILKITGNRFEFNSSKPPANVVLHFRRVSTW